MKSAGLGFWGTVGAGLVVAAVVAGVPWIFGFHHAAWLWITAAARSAWAALVFPLPIPAWLAAVFVAAFLYLLRWRIRHVSRSPVPATLPAVVVDEPPPMTDNETVLLRLLARADGVAMNAHELAQRAALAKLVTNQTLDKLRGRGLTREFGGWQGVLLYSLTPAGRDYVIDKGYVPRAPTVAERRARG